LPLDIELYQKADSLPEGNADPEFKKKPEIARDLIDQSLARGYRPGIVLIDAGYGNNTSFLQELEKRKLKYIGGIAKNRKVIVQKVADKKEEIRVDNLLHPYPPKLSPKFNYC
jgi:SRSO17 transposase